MLRFYGFSATQMLKNLNKEDDNLKNIKNYILLIGSGDTGKLLIKHLIHSKTI